MSIEPQDPRLELLKHGGPMLQAMGAVLKDPVCTEWFDVNGFDHSDRCQLVLSLAKLGLTFGKYSEFLERVILKGSKQHERKTNLDVPSD